MYDLAKSDVSFADSESRFEYVDVVSPILTYYAGTYRTLLEYSRDQQETNRPTRLDYLFGGREGGQNDGGSEGRDVFIRRSTVEIVRYRVDEKGSTVEILRPSTGAWGIIINIKTDTGYQASKRG